MALAPRAAGGVALAMLPLVSLVPLPLPRLLAVLLLTLTILAALHGLGRVVGWLAGDGEAPIALAMMWGVAAHIAIGGVLLATHTATDLPRTLVSAAGIVAGAAWLARRPAREVNVRRPPPAAALVAAALVAAALAALHVAAAAGLVGLFDEESGYLGQLRRLADTGALADGTGFTRSFGLGGQLMLASLAAPLGDLAASAMVDRGVLFAVVLAWIVTAGRRGGFTALVVVLVTAAVPDFGPAMAPRWSILALVLGAAATLERADRLAAPRLIVVTLVLAAALATVRHAGAVFLLGLLPGALALARRDLAPAARRRGIVGSTAVIVAVIAPYVVAALDAGPTIVIAPRGGGLILGALAGGLLALLARAATTAAGAPRSATASLDACAATLAAVSALLPLAAAWRAAVVLVAAWLVLVAALALSDQGDRDPAPSSLALAVIASVAITAGLALGRFPLGRELPAWSQRVGTMLSDARALDAARVSGDERARHGAVLRGIPPSARIGLWLERPDLVDHRGHQIHDLRNTTARACLDALAAGSTWWGAPASCRAVERALTRVDVVVAATAPWTPPRTSAPSARALLCRTFGGCRHPLARATGPDGPGVEARAVELRILGP